MNRELVQDAIELFGKELVTEVIGMVRLADPDFVHTTYEDMEMHEHVECVEMLFFG